MIEFKEVFTDLGIIQVRLVADGLPERSNGKDYQYKITVYPQELGGRVVAQSRSWGAGSTRYHHFKTYEEAQEHAVAWAKRKIAEERRRQALLEKSRKELAERRPDLVAA